MHVRLGMHALSCRRLSFGSTVVQARIAAMNPQYFEYQIDRGVEWIRIYTPSMWRPVPEDASVPDPLYASTYREWRRSYHFQVYWSEDSTGGTTLDPIATPSAYVSYHVWEYRDWQTRGYQRLATPVLRDACQCGRRVLGGIVGTGWGVAGTVTATIP